MSEISPIWPTGCRASSCAYVSMGCIGDLIVPGATAFTRIPRFAYSIASDLVAPFRLPFVSEASTDGMRASALSTRFVVICTTWPATPLLHLGDGELCDVKEPVDVDAHDRPVVGLGVLGERFGDEDAGVVDERVDAPEPCHAFGDRTRGRLPIGDVAGDDKNVVVARRLDRACRRDHPIVAIAVGLDEGRSDALGCAGNDSNFLFEDSRLVLLECGLHQGISFRAVFVFPSAQKPTIFQISCTTARALADWTLCRPSDPRRTRHALR